MGEVCVKTFGCRLNAVESETIREHANAAGLGDTVIVNTCAVTGEAVRQARQSIRRARRADANARIVVTGCAAQTQPETFAAMPEVDAVLGNAEKLLAESYRALPDFGVSAEEKLRVNDIMAVTETAPQMIEGLEGQTRAFLQIQNGCDHRCTFCVIPYGRGNSRSVPMGAVVDQAHRLADAGYREIVLTGVDATSYGADLPGKPTLGRLARTLLDQVPAIARLRLSSIDSIEVDDDLMRLIADEPRFMPYLHLSLQHGDDMILKRMKRRHSRADAVRLTDEIRRLRPDVAFGADIIAGFPTETEAMFENALSIVEDCGIAFLHAFPYSPRPGTPAARMPQIDRRLVKERAARLRAVGERGLKRHLHSMVGRTATLLAERGGIARTENFTSVRLANVTPGTLVARRLSGHDGRYLIASPARDAAA
ncbi:tRNA (N(6)-L-threonylcarbamoyladenosine(37)-C(2))-methylthiotransferase MtaB [Pararhizobium mangrovi]|uniref:tRNA (N(6)-L-threonylcarbamoyladenosine(37)-C(2))-methylthiotransferase MtaB n=1 Tax=Pararhizobium mangrovi TaxID=2590452 RepID=A0A506U562_9HYPH|nr:tRNA (N(6)-L-threonylcarbamoyladenosine(37)-C(2))-methylthiotransferase MtaB [Pararhizobium mangrovi]TPW27057.1 tRNA (N(6)-L-threonylcarbamoyladenosine(37)-C(2))-methylthiotransferase MtaB [Pararhizobium mangrovi]